MRGEFPDRRRAEWTATPGRSPGKFPRQQIPCMDTGRGGVGEGERRVAGGVARVTPPAPSRRETGPSARTLQVKGVGAVTQSPGPDRGSSSSAARLIDLVSMPTGCPRTARRFVGTRFLQGFRWQGANRPSPRQGFGATVASLAAVATTRTAGRFDREYRMATGRARDDAPPPSPVVGGTTGVAPDMGRWTGMKRIRPRVGQTRSSGQRAEDASRMGPRPPWSSASSRSPKPRRTIAFRERTLDGEITVLNLRTVDDRAGPVAVHDWLRRTRWS